MTQQLRAQAAYPEVMSSIPNSKGKPSFVMQMYMQIEHSNKSLKKEICFQVKLGS